MHVRTCMYGFTFEHVCVCVFYFGRDHHSIEKLCLVKERVLQTYARMYIHAYIIHTYICRAVADLDKCIQRRRKYRASDMDGMYVHTYICMMYVCRYACVCICIYVSMNIFARVRICVYV
jgi:hypothetical protein